MELQVGGAGHHMTRASRDAGGRFLPVSITATRVPAFLWPLVKSAPTATVIPILSGGAAGHS